MTELLNDMETALADVIQSGIATAGPGIAARLGTLSARCEDQGLHTGAQLLASIEQKLRQRSHTMEKEDLALAAQICRAARYIELCREKLQEEQIQGRWSAGNQGGNP